MAKAKPSRVGAQPELTFDKPTDRYYCADCLSDECILRGTVAEGRTLNAVLASLGYAVRDGGLYGMKTVSKGGDLFHGTASMVWHWLVRRGEVQVRR